MRNSSKEMEKCRAVKSGKKSKQGEGKRKGQGKTGKTEKNKKGKKRKGKKERGTDTKRKGKNKGKGKRGGWSGEQIVKREEAHQTDKPVTIGVFLTFPINVIYVDFMNEVIATRY